MGLYIHLERVQPTEVYWANITHNLSKMASAAGIYECLWLPNEHGFETAGEIIEPLSQGIARMEADPARYKTFDPANGWGSYDDFLPWLRKYLEKCREYPDAKIRVSR